MKIVNKKMTIYRAVWYDVLNRGSGASSARAVRMPSHIGAQMKRPVLPSLWRTDS